MSDSEKIKVMDWLLECRRDFLWENVLFEDEKVGCHYLEDALLRIVE